MVDKDYFKLLYKRDLAKRLLLDVSDRNMERAMLSKMRTGRLVSFMRNHFLTGQ